MDHLLWLSTLVPGFAVLQTFYRHDGKRGILGTLSWSFAISMGLMTPVVALAHLFHFSVQAVALIYASFLVLGVALIIKFTQWSTLRQSFSLSYLPELLVILLVVTIAVWTGGGARWDHQMHSAKVLFLRDAGFSLQDPYSPQPVIESKFHINTLHAVHAVISFLSSKEPLDLWYGSSWFFGLMVFGGLDVLAITVFGRAWYGILAMLGAVFSTGFNDANSLPFVVAAFVVFPILLAQVLRTLERPTKSRFLMIVALSIALASIHVASWLIVFICLVPALLVWSFWHYKQAGSSVTSIFILLGLLPGALLLLVTAVQPNYIAEIMGHLDQGHIYSIRLAERLVLRIIRPTDSLYLLPTAALIILLVLVKRRDLSSTLVLAAVFFTSLLLMFNPLFFELLIRLTPLPSWIIARAEHLAKVIAFVTIPCVFAWIGRSSLQSRINQLIFAFVVLSFSFVVFKRGVVYYSENRPVEQSVLQKASDLRTSLEPFLSERLLVCADPEMSLLIPAVQVSAVMSPELGNANPADAGVIERHNDCNELLDPQTSVDRRKEIASEHGIDLVIVRTVQESRRSDFQDIGNLVVERDWYQVFQLQH